MDVSRVEAISPKQVDWRKLTAKEIIKYENEGIDVPIQYLQWAKEFIQDVSSSDNDETTYETANNQTTQASIPDNENQNQTENVDDENSEGSQSDSELTPAQARRQQLNDDGVSLYKQARIFRRASRKSVAKNFMARISMAATERASQNEIQDVDNYMKRILFKAEHAQSELKSELGKIGQESSNRISFSKINRLQKQLEKYGNEGQANLVKADGRFSGYDSSINDKTDIIFTGSDVGTQAVEIGNELAERGDIVSVAVGKRTIRKGNKAIASSEKSQTLQTDALSLNAQNQSSITDYKGELESKTGVAAIDKSSKNDATDNKSTSDDNQNSKSQTETTETDKAASGNLDSILKAKIRKGENLET
jgi:hypothetical protein